MNPPEKIKPFVRTVHHQSQFSRYITYAVHGFWSGDSARVNQTIYDPSKGWDQPRISWSSGGEDHKAEPDRAFATECFAAAMKDAAKMARRWVKTKTPTKP